MAEIDAARPALVIHGRHRRVRRPPVPAELVHGLADQRTRTAQAAVAASAVCVSGDNGSPDRPDTPIMRSFSSKKGRECIVVDRPVVGDAVERLHFEIAGMQPRPVRGVHHRRAADAVEVDDLDRRVVVIDRVVLGSAANVWTRRPVAIEFASQSRPVLGYSDWFIQPPWSRQRICILVSARLQATAAPDAPAPMIRTSTGSFIQVP